MNLPADITTLPARHHDRPPRAGFAPRVVLVLRTAVHVLMRWQARHEQRLALRAASDTRLADCGLTREQAEREASRPFWR